MKIARKILWLGKLTASALRTPAKEIWQNNAPSDVDAGKGIQPLMHRPYDSIEAEPGTSAGEKCEDAGIIGRIRRAYLKSCEAEPIKASAVWRTISNAQSALHQTLIGGDSEQLARLLRRPGDTNLFLGIDNLVADSVENFRRNPAMAMGHAKLCQDHLVRLAEVLGALRFENPVSPRQTQFQKKADELLALIEEVIGHRIEFPNPYPDESGIRTASGIASYRTFHAVYQANRIKELLSGLPNPRVLEIGGGLGRTAYYARQFGVRSYAIVDLPFTAVSQAYFLMRTLGENCVQLDNEVFADSADRVRLMRPTSFLQGSEHYDIIINVDSITEMNRKTAEKYFQKIQESTTVFLSINHEANEFTARELMDSSTRTVRKHRYPYGMRRGYVEELAYF
jgi:hypothetical protein